MNAETALTGAYQEWRGLAETEGEAIRKQDWNLVSACQNALRELQTRIAPLTEQARNEREQSGSEAGAREESLRAMISELVEIERRNNILLDAVRSAAQVHSARLEETSRNLKRVQRIYSPARPAAWTSFS